MAFDALVEPVWIMDVERRILRCNRAAIQLCGEDIVGRHCWEVIHGSKGQFADRSVPCLKCGDVREAGEVFIGSRWFSVTVDPLLKRDAKAGEIVCGMIHVMRDITDRKQTENALKEAKAKLEKRVAGREIKLRQLNGLLHDSEAKLRRFIENAPVAIAMFDHDMRYLAASRRWLQDYRLQEANVMGRSHYEAFPGQPKGWKLCHQRGLAGEVLSEGEEQFIRSDGAVQWQQREIRPWFDASGEIGGIVIFIENITERKLAQEAVARSERLFRLLFETMLQGVVFYDTAGRIIVMNPAAERILGVTLTESLLGGTLATPERPTLRENGSPLAASDFPSNTASRTGQEVRDMVMGVYNPRLKDYRWICASAVPVHSPGADNSQQVYVIFDDVTSRRQAEMAVKASESALKQAQRLAAVGSWEWDIPSNRHWWSEEVYRIYGRDPALPPAVYPEVKQYFTKDSWARLSDTIEICLRDGTAYKCDAELTRPDGESRWITARGVAVRDAAGNVISLHGTVQDISERKRTEELLQRANHTLQAIRACHEAMLRARTETDLLNEICRIIVETGGERMAWVGYGEKKRGKAVRPVARAGFRKYYADNARITWADVPRGRGPVGTAIRTGNICICRDTLTDPNFAPWREDAIKFGYGSVIALPLKEDGNCFGALCIYAPKPDVFDAGEQHLFADLANDLAFGVATLRLRAERERLENEILHSIEREQERIGRDLHDGLCQLLVGAKYRSVYLEKILAGKEPEAAQEALLLEDILNQATEQTRDLARGLNPVKPTVNGLEHALRRLADHVRLGKNGDPHCFCHFPNETRISDHKLANHLYRIAQEAVQNAVKHAGAKNISITLDRQHRQIRLIVKDDGRGIPAKLMKTGMGLDNMRTRAALIGGTLDICRRKHGGTAVNCTVVSPTTGPKS